MCTVLLPPGGYPIAVNKHIHRIWHWSEWDPLRTSNLCTLHVNSPFKFWVMMTWWWTKRSKHVANKLKNKYSCVRLKKKILLLYFSSGDCGGTVVKVLCYKSEGRWFDPSWCQWIFHWHKIPPIALWPWGRQPLTEMRTRSISLG